MGTNIWFVTTDLCRDTAETAMLYFKYKAVVILGGYLMKLVIPVSAHMRVGLINSVIGPYVKRRGAAVLV